MANRATHGRVWLLFAIAATLALGGTPGKAATITIYSSEAAFDADHPGLTVEDFEDANVNTVSACPSPADTNSDNVCFSPGDIIPGITISDRTQDPIGLALFGPGFAEAANKSLTTNHFGTHFYIDFNPAPGAVGLQIWKWLFSGTCTVWVTTSDSETEVFTLPCSTGAGTFLGLGSDTPITTIEIASDSAGDQNAQGIAALKFGEFPTTCSRHGLTGRTLAEQLTGTDINESGPVSSQLHAVEADAGPAAPAVHEASCVTAAAGT
jgi:hypothetical protein